MCLHNGIRFYVMGSSDRFIAIPFSELEVDRWYHLAATYDQSSGAMKLYLDGVLKASGSAPNIDPYTGPFKVSGWNGAGGRHLDGAVRDVKVYSRVLTATEIEQLSDGTAITGGLVLDAPLQSWHGTGTTDDLSGNGYVGTLYGFDLSSPVSAREKVSRFAYDYRSRRYYRSTPSTPHMYSVFDGGLSIQEYEPVVPMSPSGGLQTSDLRTEFVRGEGMGGGVGGMVYSIKRPEPNAQSQTPRIICSHANHRGDVIARSDETGSLTSFALYEAYGTRPYEWEAAGTLGDPDRQKANTKEEETDLNLLNEGMRYRDLETGVFLTRDPIGYADGPNVYCYVHCNPITKFDAFGLAEGDTMESYQDQMDELEKQHQAEMERLKSEMDAIKAEREKAASMGDLQKNSAAQIDKKYEMAQTVNKYNEQKDSISQSMADLKASGWNIDGEKSNVHPSMKNGEPKMKADVAGTKDWRDPTPEEMKTQFKTDKNGNVSPYTTNGPDSDFGKDFGVAVASRERACNQLAGSCDFIAIVAGGAVAAPGVQTMYILHGAPALIEYSALTGSGTVAGNVAKGIVAGLKPPGSGPISCPSSMSTFISQKVTQQVVKEVGIYEDL
jgi:RHS repeat-associated protein